MYHPKSSANTAPPLIFWVGLLLLVVIAIVAAFTLSGSFPLTADEGLYITWGRLLAAGYEPYTEVYLTNPPLSPLFLQVVWAVGASPEALKLTLLALWGIGLVAMALLAHEMSGDWRAGLGAAFLLAFSVQYFAESQAILVHNSSILAGMIAMWLALIYQRSGNRLALVGSALFTAISLEIKLLSPFLLPLVFGVVLSRHVLLQRVFSLLHHPELRREVLKVALIWGTALLALPLISLLIWDAQAMVYSAVLQRLSAREAYPPGAGENEYTRSLKLLGGYVVQHRALIGLGLLGLAVAVYTQKRGQWLALGWLGGAVAMLSFHSPLYEKHFALLSGPLALAAAFLFPLVSLVPKLSLGTKETRASRVLGGVLLVGLLGFGAEFFGQLPAWRTLAQTPDPPLAQIPAIEFIREVTSPTDCLITDYSQLLLWTSRFPPPALAEVSSSRLRSGFLTTPELKAITETYDCPVVAPLTGRFHRSSLDYIKWVEGRYRGLLVYTADKQILYFGKPIDPAKVAERAIPQNVRFGHDQTTVELELLGYEALPDAVTPGDSLPLKLFWRPTANLATDYTIFVQFRNAAGVTIANADHQPYKGLLPFSHWSAGEVMPETTWLDLPPGLPPGDYTLFIGLYNQTNGERLPILDDPSGENAVLLKTIPGQYHKGL